MKVKKYKAESLPKAIQLAKKELGEEIVLLESKEIKDKGNWSGGKKSVEISVATYEKKPDALKKKVEPWNPPKIQSKTAAATTAKEAYKKTQGNFDQVLTDVLSEKPKDFQEEKLILKEISELKKELKQLTRKTIDSGDKHFPEPYMKVYNTLEERGVDQHLASTFVQRSYFLHDGEHNVDTKSIVKNVRTEMEKVFKPYEFPKNNQARKQEIILLLGSTGVGKSTTSMKLATHKDLYGKKKVGIISTDPYGPTTALRSFEKITGITVVEAKAFEEITLAIESLQDKDVIIVDTPGSSPFAPNHLDKLEKYIETVNPSDIFLVLSMTTDTRDLFLSCGTYILLKPTGIIFTKFDETTQPGKVYSIIDELELPVVCFCEGERIFIDVEAGNHDYLPKKIFELH